MQQLTQDCAAQIRHHDTYAQLEDWNTVCGALVCNLDVLVYFTSHVCADCTHKNRRLLWPKMYVLAWCLNSEKTTQKKEQRDSGTHLRDPLHSKD